MDPEDLDRFGTIVESIDIMLSKQCTVFRPRNSNSFEWGSLVVLVRCHWEGLYNHWLAFFDSTIYGPSRESVAFAVVFKLKVAPNKLRFCT